ncbi:MAG: TIGR03790 family protein, partial [Gammaproteobacteria bacterium]|nr:TIGR03790 family protein [Gammaproteobacteria bacterium]
MRTVFFLLIAVCSLSVSAATNDRPLSEKLAIIVNTNDPDSQRIADYYQQKRNIPDENIIVVELSSKSSAISAEQFQKVYQQVQEKTPEHIQFYALAWSKIHTVACMSITSAFT